MQKEIFEIIPSRKAKKESPRLNLIKYLIVQDRKFDVSQNSSDYCLLGEIVEGKSHAYTLVTDVGGNMGRCCIYW